MARSSSEVASRSEWSDKQRSDPHTLQGKLLQRNLGDSFLKISLLRRGVMMSYGTGKIFVCDTK